MKHKFLINRYSLAFASLLLWIVFIQSCNFKSNYKIKCKTIKEKVSTGGNKTQYYFVFTDGDNERVFLQEYLSYDVNEEYCY